MHQFLDRCNLMMGWPTRETALVAALIALMFTISAQAQIPCSYEVAAIIEAPPGPTFPSPTHAAAISPNGRYVCGRYRPNASDTDKAFVYDTKTKEFIPLPMPPVIGCEEGDV